MGRKELEAAASPKESEQRSAAYGADCKSNSKFCSRTMCLNGQKLVLGEGDAVPEMTGVVWEGKVEVAHFGCTFIVL